MKNVMKNALLGAAIGLSMSYIIITIVLLQHPTHTVNGKELFLQFLLAIVVGIGCGVALALFRIERWSIAMKLAVHYVISLVLVLICGFIGDWYNAPTENPVGFILFFAFHLAAYMVIFGVLYGIALQEVRSINDKLKQR